VNSAIDGDNNKFMRLINLAKFVAEIMHFLEDSKWIYVENQNSMILTLDKTVLELELEDVVHHFKEDDARRADHRRLTELMTPTPSAVVEHKAIFPAMDSIPSPSTPELGSPTGRNSLLIKLLESDNRRDNFSQRRSQ